MRMIRAGFAVACCLFLAWSVARAQGRKPGLWEMTSNMTWQQSPLPAGMSASNSAFAPGPRISQVCLTQAQIDKYGAILPQGRNNCQVVNVVKKANGMTADMVCTGRINGKGSLESTWTDDAHATGKFHFVGTMQMGQDTKPIEWTTESSSAFKGPDCGDVKPAQMPEK